MKKLLTKLTILLCAPLVAFAANVKTQGDANLGSLDGLKGTDILYVSRSPHDSGNDGYITGENLTEMLGGRAVYDAVIDGGIVADYVDRLTPGTGQLTAINTWIDDGLIAGKRRFSFPAGKYRIDLVGSMDVVDINGYDNVEIFGVNGETFFYTSQGMELWSKDSPMFRVGLTQTSKNFSIHDITFINDPYVSNARGTTADGDIKWGWKYYEPHRESQAYERGDYIVSTDDNWLILVTASGTSSATEPTWSTGTTSDGTCTVVVVALANWAALTSYAEGAHVKSTLTTGGQSSRGNQHSIGGVNYRSILRASNGGTSGDTANEPLVSLPSNDGYDGVLDDNYWQWVGLGAGSSQAHIYRCEFSGMAGFGQAGGLALGMTGEGGGLVEDCYFHDAQYGGVVTGFFSNWTFRDCSHYKLGGWGFNYGTYNAHGYYTQGGRNLWDNCDFDRHFYGLDIKFHANVANTDVWQNRIVNCRFANYGWGAVAVLGGGEINDEEAAGGDFILSATSGNKQSAIMQKQGVIANSTFRIFKSAYDNWDWRRPSALPNGESRGAIYVNANGINIVGCDFTDTHGVETGTSHEWLGENTPTAITASSFQTIFRAGNPLSGTVWADNCQFDFRAKLGIATGVRLNNYSRLSNSSIIASTTLTAHAIYGALVLDGLHVKVDNCQIILTGAGHPVSWGQGSGGTDHNYVSMTNSIIDAPSGTMFVTPRSASSHWRFANNFWNISGWDYFRLTGAANETWIWENERGNLFSSRWDATYDDYHMGIVKVIPLSGNYSRTIGDLIDEDATLVSSSASIYGVYLHTDNQSTYRALVAVSENANHWLRASEQVTKGDWITMSGTAGQVAPNGTTGSTTRPATGIQGRVIDVGTASAGAGRALVEIIEWNR